MLSSGVHVPEGEISRRITGRTTYRNPLARGGEAEVTESPPTTPGVSETTPASAETQTVRNRFEGVRTRKEIDEIITEQEALFKRSEKFPTNEEIARVYEYGKTSDRKALEESFLKMAFEKAGTTDLHLGHAQVLENDEEIPWDQVKKQANTPQIFVKQIYEVEDKRNLLDIAKDYSNMVRARLTKQEYDPEKAHPDKYIKKPAHPPQAMVIVAFNNSRRNAADHETDNTVLTAVVHFENNKIDLSQECKMQLTTQTEARAATETDADTSLNARMMRGELTLAQYNQKFLKSEKITVEEHEQHRDDTLTRDLRAAESDRYKNELMERLTVNYNEALQEAQERRTQIIAEIAGKAKTTKEYNEKVRDSDEFMNLVSESKAGNVSPRTLKLLRQSLLRTFPNISSKELEALIVKG